MRHGSLFSGIGGFDLAAEWMGWENVFHCEINEFGRKVLKYYWPDAESFEDITKTDFKKYNGAIDIISGGFPCQPYSVAGKRKGKEDERHLWPEMLRAIREIQPRWVVGENVFGIVNWSGGLVFHEVQTDLEAEGYEVWPYVLPACAVNAPHRRDRIWFVAYSNSNRKMVQRRDGNCNNEQWNAETEIQKRENEFFGINCSNNERFTSDALGVGMEGNWAEGQQELQAHAQQRLSVCSGWGGFPTVSPICNRNDGFPGELVGLSFPKWRAESIKAMGNAIVPQVVYEIFKAIEETESFFLD
jgi:DNA (cytosine-5)-methyltransferase 1